MDSKDTLSSIDILFEGAVAQLNTRPLSSVALAGLLSGVLESVNMVNAPVILRERNISVSETKRENVGDYPTLVRVSVTYTHGGQKVTRSVGGTIFGGEKLLRIVEVDGIPIEAELAEQMIYIRNGWFRANMPRAAFDSNNISHIITEDKPGFIGRFASLLGAAGLNIATFHLGRVSAGGLALALCAVDQEVPAEVLEQIRAVPGVLVGKVLKF